MDKNFITNKRNELFFLTLFATVVLIIGSSFLPALDSTNQENYIRLIAQNQFSSLSKNHIENNLSTQALNNIDLDTSDYDLLDYDDYVKPHKILDRSNTSLYTDHLQKTFITKKVFSFNNLFPQYPPMERIIRLKNFLI